MPTAQRFLAYINKAGKVLDTVAISGGRRHAVFSITKAGDGKYCIAGIFLGEIKIGEVELKSSSYSQMFVAMLEVTESIGEEDVTGTTPTETITRDTISFGLDISNINIFWRNWEK